MATDSWPPATSSWPCRPSESPVHNNPTRFHRPDSTAWGSGWGTCQESGATSGGPTRTRCSAALSPRGRSGLGTPESWCAVCWSAASEEHRPSIGAMATCPGTIGTRLFLTSRTPGPTAFRKGARASSLSCVGGISPKRDSLLMGHLLSRQQQYGRPRNGSGKGDRPEPHRKPQSGHPQYRKDCPLSGVQDG